MFHKITSEIIAHTLKSKLLLIAFHTLFTVGAYIEAGPITAIMTYFGFFLLISLAMHLKNEADKERMIAEVMKNKLGGSLKDILKKAGKTTKFSGDDFEGSMTEVDMNDLPPEIRDILDKIVAKDKDEEEEDEKPKYKH